MAPRADRCGRSWSRKPSLNSTPSHAVHGGDGTPINAYEGIEGGFPDKALAEITGQDSIEYTSGQLESDAATIGEAFQSGKEVELTTDTDSRAYNKHLFGDHAYEVIGYDASTDAFTLHNPWGSASSKPMTFTVSADDLAAAGCSMYVAQGTASDPHAAVHADLEAHAAMEASLASTIGAIHGPVGHFLL